MPNVLSPRDLASRPEHMDEICHMFGFVRVWIKFVALEHFSCSIKKHVHLTKPKIIPRTQSFCQVFTVCHDDSF